MPRKFADRTVKNQRRVNKVRPPIPELALTPNEISLSNADGKSTIAVFDLDGCVADDAWRFNFVQGHEDADRRFEHYHKALVCDDVLEPGARLLRRAIEMGAHILFITARPEAVRSITEKWIDQNFGISVIKSEFSLIMRGDADPTPTVEIKRRLMELALEDIEASSIIAAYDDREDVVIMYHSVFGINAFVLDKDGMRDALKLHELRMRSIHPEPSPAMEAAKSASVSETLSPLLSPLKMSYYGTDFKGKFEPIRDCGWGESGESFEARTDYNDVPAIMREMADTFESRNADYGNSGIKIGEVMAVLFPNGVAANSIDDFRVMGHFERVIAKLVRFVNSGMKHKDSIHDLACYAALVEADVSRHNIKFKR